MKNKKIMILALGVVVAHGPHGRFEVCCSLLLNLVGQMVDLESVEPGHKLIGWTLWPVFWMHHEEHVYCVGIRCRNMRHPCDDASTILVCKRPCIWGSRVKV